MPYYGVDIFSGAGGLSLGAEMAGITMRFAIEVNESAAKTYKRNHKHTEVLCQNIKEVDLRSHFSNEPPFIIMGGPPCQGFSLSNTRNRKMKRISFSVNLCVWLKSYILNGSFLKTFLE